ncbi:MAG: DUF1273 family protein [Clostridia bacterium]|nr:DUF1273 family protein [Clostridia bacterium]
MAKRYYPAEGAAIRQTPPLLAEGRGKRPDAVCFTGHRQLSHAEKRELTSRLDSLLEACWLRGYTTFICGGALGFDTLAAQRVICAKRRHPELKLVLALPCGNQSSRWSASDCQSYEQILIHADETHVLSPQYYDGCMMRRNRYMVDHASLCICYLNKMKGGTMSTVAYAVREQCPLLNAAMPDKCAAFVQEAMLTCSPPS